VWLHAVIDNFSRRILVWRVAERFEIANAAAILEEAVGNTVSADELPTLMTDGGIENFNGEVDALVGEGLFHGLPGRDKSRRERFDLLRGHLLAIPHLCAP
jgi:transposase InsO family protein